MTGDDEVYGARRVRSPSTSKVRDRGTSLQKPVTKFSTEASMPNQPGKRIDLHLSLVPACDAIRPSDGAEQTSSFGRSGPAEPTFRQTRGAAASPFRTPTPTSVRRRSIPEIIRPGDSTA